MLTDPGDLVVDIFAGSNTTGFVAQNEERQWLSFDESREYVAASVLRFLPKGTSGKRLREVYDSVVNGNDTRVPQGRHQPRLIEV